MRRSRSAVDGQTEVRAQCAGQKVRKDSEGRACGDAGDIHAGAGEGMPTGRGSVEIPHSQEATYRDGRKSITPRMSGYLFKQVWLYKRAYDCDQSGEEKYRPPT